MGDDVRRAVCPGSFDPVTNGHLDIIGRAAALYDEVVVAVCVNPVKTGLFTVEERIAMLREAPSSYANVTRRQLHGLLVDYCRDNDIPVIVKGLRAVSDFDYELQMAQMNRGLAGVETLFMPTNPQYSLPLLQPGQGGRDVRRRRLVAWCRKAVHDRLHERARLADRRRRAMTEVVYRADETVDELIEVIETARSVPMSSSCMVPRDHLLDLLDELREVLPDEVQQAGAIVEQRTEILQQAQAEAERLTGRTRSESEQVVAAATASATSSSAPPAASATSPGPGPGGGRASCWPRPRRRPSELVAEAAGPRAAARRRRSSSRPS